MVKPRLESAPLTREDRLIWLNINFPLGKKAGLKKSPAYLAADRRDADLMLAIMSFGRECVGYPAAALYLWRRN